MEVAFTIIKIIFGIILVAALPVIPIFALNLLGMSIPYTFSSWLGMFILMWAFNLTTR